MSSFYQRDKVIQNVVITILIPSGDRIVYFVHPLFISPQNYGVFIDIVLDGSVIWTSFSFLKFSMLGGVVIMICGMSFGPFIYLVS